MDLAKVTIISVSGIGLTAECELIDLFVATVLVNEYAIKQGLKPKPSTGLLRYIVLPTIEMIENQCQSQLGVGGGERTFGFVTTYSLTNNKW